VPERKAPSPPVKPQAGNPHADFWICLLLFLTTLIVYVQVRHFEFVNFDDPQSVSDNPIVRNGVTRAGIAWAFTSGAAANWFPLTRLSEMLDCQFFGLRSGWHHLENVLFHTLAVLLLFAFLHRATRARWPSAFVAALFALHPLHVESVAWVAERKDVLNACFWFLSLWAYAGYAAASGGRQWRWYAVALAAFAMGLLAKPMIVTLPFVLLLLDLWPLRRPLTSASVLEKLPFFALSAAAAAVTYLVQRNSGAVTLLASVPLGVRLENALISYFAYIAKMFWPANLAVFYPYPLHLPAWQVILAALGMAGVTTLVLSAFRSHPYLAIGWFWYVGTLVPVIGFVQVGSQARADRYMYVPMVGLGIMLAWAGAGLAARRPRAKAPLVALAAMVCAVCAVLTGVQLGYWKDSESLFTHALDVTGGSFVAHYNLGVALSSKPDRLPEAIREYRAALEIRPGDADASNNLAVALNNWGFALANTAGRLDDAIAAYQAALRIKPAYATAHYNLGNALMTLPGGTGDAITEYQAAIRIEPDSVEANNNLAAALARIPGGTAQAEQEYRRVLRLKPAFAEAHFNLGNLLAGIAGRLPDAIAEYREALRLRPDYAEAHGNLGAVLARTPGGLPDAIAAFEAALRFRPDLAETQYDLGIALLRMPGRRSEAVSHLEAAQRIRPDPQLAAFLSRLR